MIGAWLLLPAAITVIAAYVIRVVTVAERGQR